MEKREVSSAKNLTYDSIPSSRSLMYMRNSKGPRTEPCGTPAFISPQLDCKIQFILSNMPNMVFDGLLRMFT